MEKHYCINCGKEASHQHHVVPNELGGNNDKNLVWLCDNCHGLIHGIEYNKGQLSHSELTKIGIEKARHKISYKCICLKDLYEKLNQINEEEEIITVIELLDLLDNLPVRYYYTPNN